MIEINTLDLEELNIYRKYNENQLQHYFEPAPGIFIAESPKVIERALNAGYEPISLLIEKGHVAKEAVDIINRLESEYKIPVYLADPGVLIKLTGYELTRGALCAMKRKTLLSAYDLCHNSNRIAILEDVVNPTNIGSIVRNAAALGLDGILFTSGCSDPLYRRALRVSMGTTLQIPWTFINDKDIAKNNYDSYVDMIKEWGYTTISMALKDDSCVINDPVLYRNKKIAIILGTEGEGLRPLTIAKSNFTVCIPMKHGVDSLNVASASAIAFFNLMQN